MAEVKWKISDLGKFLWECGRACLRGELLIRLKVGKYFIHIIWMFFLLFCTIGSSLIVENTLTKVEDNKKVLNDLQIYHAQKTAEIVSLGRITTVEQMLKDNGSKLTMPQTPPNAIGK